MQILSYNPTINYPADTNKKVIMTYSLTQKPNF